MRTTDTLEQVGDKWAYTVTVSSEAAILTVDIVLDNKPSDATRSAIRGMCIVLLTSAAGGVFEQ